MSYRCDVCGKEPWFGKQVSFSHKRSSRRWLPNIQRVRVKHGSNSRRIRVCTSCIKAGKVEKVLLVQGVVKVYDPRSGVGVIVRDDDLSEVFLRPGSLDGSMFRMLRQGQRVIFDTDEDDGRLFARDLRFGADGY